MAVLSCERCGFRFEYAREADGRWIVRPIGYYAAECRWLAEGGQGRRPQAPGAIECPHALEAQGGHLRRRRG